MDIPKQAMKLGRSLAEEINRTLESGDPNVTATAVIITEGMDVETNFSNCFDFLSYPLSSHIPDSDISELYVVGDKLETRKKVPKKRINSNLLAVEFVTNTGLQLKGPLTHPAVITLKHLHADQDHFDPACGYWDESMWAKDGCKVDETSVSETVSKCTHFSTFAVIMKVEKKVDDSDREMVVTVATVLGSFSILGLLICAIVAIVINYHQKDHMRIALNIDVALLLSQLVFFIGLSTGDNMFFSKPKTCDVVNPFVHFFELAALTWLLMEALYYYSTLKPLFNEKNTVPIVFYFAVGWGLPVAFASACAEYAYPHFGTPEKSEFCWMFIGGGEAWFFGGPVLILVLLNLLARVFVVKEIVCWQDDPDDIRIERAKTRLMTSSAMMAVIVLTWLFGVLAVNHTEDKIYHYIFIVFYTFQGLLVLLFYCIRNQEVSYVFVWHISPQRFSGAGS
ncbi:adhesion G protein-coupled receptor L3-like [Orbicella faveolata]|uniref:adhesion G protein-coupled receptor L3-like n=1 Tax=Orbicella faveolata TaxID=48498 RepID=UPI0009E18A6F|nr:adhesion G protein-coupled receptor L3-like [Orbicella faveolata]